MTTQVVNARIDAQLKKEVDYILSRIGLTGAEAIRLYYTQIRNKKGIPFTLTVGEEPKERVIQSMENIEQGKNIETIGTLDDFKKMYEAL